MSTDLIDSAARPTPRACRLCSAVAETGAQTCTQCALTFAEWRAGKRQLRSVALRKRLERRLERVRPAWRLL